LGAAAASGIQSGFKTGDPLAGILSAGGSYLGSNIAGNVLGDKLGTIGGTLNSVGGGDFAGNILGSQLASAPISSALGGAIGSSLGESFAGNTLPSGSQSQSTGPEPFKPSREAQQDIPGSLSQLGSLSPQQLETNLATQGTYGGGLGPGEQSYFLNMINRRLVDDSGNVSGDTLAPVEHSYLSQLGLDGGSNMDLLEAISRRRASA